MSAKDVWDKEFEFTPEKYKTDVENGFTVSDLEPAQTYQMKVSVTLASDTVVESETMTFDTQVTNCVPDQKCCSVS